METYVPLWYHYGIPNSVKTKMFGLSSGEEKMKDCLSNSALPLFEFGSHICLDFMKNLRPKNKRNFSYNRFSPIKIVIVGAHTIMVCGSVVCNTGIFTVEASVTVF